MNVLAMAALATIKEFKKLKVFQKIEANGKFIKKMVGFIKKI